MACRYGTLRIAAFGTTAECLALYSRPSTTTNTTATTIITLIAARDRKIPMVALRRRGELQTIVAEQVVTVDKLHLLPFPFFLLLLLLLFLLLEVV